MSNIINSYRFGDAGFSFGNALSFDGVDDIVTTPNTGVFYSTFTLSVWFKFNTTLNAVIGSGGSIRATQYIGYLLDTSTFRVLNNNAIHNFVVSTMSTGTWYHAVLSVNSNSASFYLDGVASVTNPRLFTEQTKIIAIGARSNGTLNWDGEIDEYGFQPNYAATQTDVDNLYNSGSGADFASVISSPADHYKFNGSGTDTTATNDGSNSDGTLTNFPASGMWVAH